LEFKKEGGAAEHKPERSTHLEQDALPLFRALKKMRCCQAPPAYTEIDDKKLKFGSAFVAAAPARQR
jgi:hypothetical protein